MTNQEWLDSLKPGDFVAYHIGNFDLRCRPIDSRDPDGFIVDGRRFDLDGVMADGRETRLMPVSEQLQDEFRRDLRLSRAMQRIDDEEWW